MTDSHVKSENISPRRTTKSKVTEQSELMLKEQHFHRIGITQSAIVGSFYDARTNIIHCNSQLNSDKAKETQLTKLSSCTIWKSDELDIEQVFRTIGIYAEEWLSLILNIVPAEGICTLVNYSFLKNTNTRFLYYYYPSKEHYISHQQNISDDMTDIDATHIISSITLGIQVFIVLKLKSVDTTNHDSILEQIREQLITGKFELTNEHDQYLINDITVTNIFSNISSLTQMTTLADICREIISIKPSISCHRPVRFNMSAIKSFYSNSSKEKTMYIPLEPQTIKIIRQYLCTLSVKDHDSMISLNLETENVHEEKLSLSFAKFQKHLEHIRTMCTSEIEQLRTLVINIRYGKIHQNKIDELLSYKPGEILQQHINIASNSITRISEKNELINDSQQQVVDHSVFKQVSKKIKDDPNIELQEVMTMDALEMTSCPDNRSGRCNSFTSNYTKDDGSNGALDTVNMDISDSPLSFSNHVEQNTEGASPSKILFPHNNQTSIDSNSIEQQLIQQPPSSNDQTDSGVKRSHSPDPSISSQVENTSLSSSSTDNGCVDSLSSTTNTYTNILLLGESGVGKSTFINALLNYLTFHNFDQARSTHPLVVMPTSFLITTGDNFEEKIVQFGDVDPNEDHNHSGQSVTQHCRSYLFDHDSQTNIKLRIIDTPGMGDTRGLDQDDFNMQHILSFINNLSHLNAICVLLKPNESRLTIVLRSYFTRLLNFLGPNVCNNLIFCFTNTRSTFYAPGNTGPLLREMISKLPIKKDIPFKKSNTFCFDSESFRYLVCLQDGVKFDEFQTKEYMNSWTTSMNESHRFLRYICEQLKPYYQSEWQSVEHAHFKINEIIRPVLETTRNTYRNIILLEERSSNLLIQLRPTDVCQSSAICYQCERTPQRFSDFWILVDDVHTLSNKCNNCDCEQKSHNEISYTLDYEVSQYTGQDSCIEMKSKFELFKLALLEFAQFYASTDGITVKNDPVLSMIKRMIAEEDKICLEKGSTCLNASLHDMLISLRKTYRERKTYSKSIKLPIDLENMYEHIQRMSTMKEINEQLCVVKETQATYMQQNEKTVLQVAR